jgi:hypothetical protein
MRPNLRSSSLRGAFHWARAWRLRSKHVLQFCYLQLQLKRTDLGRLFRN